MLPSVEGSQLTYNGDGSYSFTGRGRVDSDGSGSLHGDPDGQHDTSLHLNGKPLNADVHPYVAFPPQFILGVEKVVLGCLCIIENLDNGKTTDAVVGDVGPRQKAGEMSCVAAELIGLDPSPTHGGTEARRIKYTYFPGKAAKINGVQYPLQPHAG